MFVCFLYLRLVLLTLTRRKFCRFLRGLAGWCPTHLIKQNQKEPFWLCGMSFSRHFRTFGCFDIFWLCFEVTRCYKGLQLHRTNAGRCGIWRTWAVVRCKKTIEKTLERTFDSICCVLVESCRCCRMWKWYSVNGCGRFRLHSPRTRTASTMPKGCPNSVS